MKKVIYCLPILMLIAASCSGPHYAIAPVKAVITGKKIATVQTGPWKPLNDTVITGYKIRRIK